MKKKRPGLQDIADQVGATKMTVSRCLRQPESVSEPLRKRILEVADTLGYIPNRAPDILSRSRSRAIGVLVPSVTNQVFAEVIAAISTVMEAAGYHVMISHYGYSPELEERRLASLLAYNIDGVILSDSIHTARTKQMLSNAAIPSVEIMDSLTPPIHQAVGYDNVAAAHDMVRAMIARGRKRIIYLAVRLDERTRQRELGYRRAMAAYDLPVRTLQSAQKSSFSVGAALMAHIFQEEADTDAIFCTNDDVAIGAYYECLRRGVAVPDAMAIAGFHGHDFGQVMTPRLASIITPRDAIGECAAAELLKRIREEPIDQPVIDLGYQIDTGGTL